VIIKTLRQTLCAVPLFRAIRPEPPDRVPKGDRYSADTGVRFPPGVP
jgi:hypothetical protein